MPQQNDQHRDEYTDRLARIETGNEQAATQLARVLYLLEGNGQPGLKTRVDRLEQMVVARGKGIDRWQAIGLVLLSALAGSGASWLIGARATSAPTTQSSAR